MFSLRLIHVMKTSLKYLISQLTNFLHKPNKLLTFFTKSHILSNRLLGMSYSKLKKTLKTYKNFKSKKIYKRTFHNIHYLNLKKSTFILWSLLMLSSSILMIPWRQNLMNNTSSKCFQTFSQTFSIFGQESMVIKSLIQHQEK